jgi:hypothetical protein
MALVVFLNGRVRPSCQMRHTGKILDPSILRHDQGWKCNGIQVHWKINFSSLNGYTSSGRLSIGGI